MSRHINAEGLEHIKRWEGLKLEAYRDSGGVWTIGYGHTSAAGAPKVVPGMRISRARAQAILRTDLRKFEARVDRLVRVELTDNQFAALVSFDFNTGALHRSTLLKKLNAGDYNAIPDELMKWTRVGRKRERGLVNRRAAEVGLWSKGSFVASAYVAAIKDTPPVIDKETVSWGAGILGTIASAASDPGPLQYVTAACVGVAFTVCCVVVACYCGLEFRKPSNLVVCHC